MRFPVGVSSKRSQQQTYKKKLRHQGAKIMAMADANGLPMALPTEAASPGEGTLVGATFESMHVEQKPFPVVAGKAYNSDSLRKSMAEEDMILLASHRSGRARPASHNGRRMRRYKKRWRLERMFAWLQNFRGLVVGYDFHAENFHAIVQFGPAIILIKHF